MKHIHNNNYYCSCQESVSIKCHGKTLQQKEGMKDCAEYVCAYNSTVNVEINELYQCWDSDCIF